MFAIVEGVRSCSLFMATHKKEAVIVMVQAIITYQGCNTWVGPEIYKYHCCVSDITRLICWNTCTIQILYPHCTFRKCQKKKKKNFNIKPNLMPTTWVKYSRALLYKLIWRIENSRIKMLHKQPPKTYADSLLMQLIRRRRLNLKLFLDWIRVRKRSKLTPN